MEEEYDDWYICGDGDENYAEFYNDELVFKPSKRTNLLGHAAEWTAELKDWQVETLAAMGDNLRIDWGVFVCPAYLMGNKLIVDTEGVW